MDEVALGVFAQAIEANVKHTQWATDRVIESEREQKISFARDLAYLYKAVEKATEVVTTRKLERILDALAPSYDAALRVINEKGVE